MSDTTENTLALLKQFGIDKAPETEQEAEAMQAKMMAALGIDLVAMQQNPMAFLQQWMALREQNEKMKTDLALIMRVVLDFIDVFGLLNSEKTSVRQEIVDGSEDIMGPVLEKIIQLATIDAPMAKFNKRKREEMEARFAFLGYIGLIVGKYPAAPSTIYNDLKAAQ